MTSLLLAVIYLSFISLGLPDSLLGSAWPTIYQQFEVPVSYAGILSAIIAVGTIVSSLQCDRLIRRFSAGVITAVSVAATALALFGFSISSSFWMLCLWAIPYGLGAGCVDAALNNYVALHYASRHMSWLHCMWGVGASIGPVIMGLALTGGKGWTGGYRYIALLQTVLVVILALSLRLWAKPDRQTEAHQGAPLSLREIIAIPGAKAILIAFFCYCALEQTCALWASSYLTLHHGLSAEQAAGWASLFFFGITAGRAASGFLTMRFSDPQLIRLGQAVILAGTFCLFLPFGSQPAQIGLVLIGLGCAPIYPCVIHSTPATFGAERSQALIGVQMASAYVGTCLMPPLFGLIANHISIGLYPVYLLAILAVMTAAYHRLTTGQKAPANEA